MDADELAIDVLRRSDALLGFGLGADAGPEAGASCFTAAGARCTGAASPTGTLPGAKPNTTETSDAVSPRGDGVAAVRAAAGASSAGSAAVRAGAGAGAGAGAAATATG
jgi:hypothetical protein